MFMKRAIALAALSASLGWVASVSADVQIESFDNFSLDNIYGSWGAPFATLSSNPTNFEINTHAYGSGYKYLGATIDASADDTVRLDVTVNQGVAGFILDLNDTNNDGQQYAWVWTGPRGRKRQRKSQRIYFDHARICGKLFRWHGCFRYQRDQPDKHRD